MNSEYPETAAPSVVPNWGALVMLLLVYTVHSIDRNAFSVLLDPIGREFTLSDRELGLLAGFIYVVPFALASIPLGILVDRVNRKRLVAAILSCWSGATMLAGLATGFLSLAAARAAVGAAEAGTPPSCLSLLSDIFPPNLRPTAVSIFYVGAPMGVLVGSASAGAIANEFGWRTALVALGVPGILLAALLMLFFREPARTIVAGESTGSLVDVLSWLKRPEVMLAVSALVVAGMVVLGAGAWISVFLVRAHGVSMAQVGGVVGLIFGLGGVAGSLCGGLLAGQVAKGRDARLPLISAAALLLAAPCLVAALLSPSYTVTIAALIPFGILSAAYYGPAYGLCLNLTPGHIRGRAISVIFILANIVGGGLGPYLVGFASDVLAHGHAAAPLAQAMMVLPALAIVAGLLFLGTSRALGRSVT